MAMSTPNPSNSLPESTRRRSQRVILSLPVTVRCEGASARSAFVEETRTLVVNEHGALIALANAVESGQTLLLFNPGTGLEQSCKVSYVGSPADGKVQVGLKFLAPSPQFWAIAFSSDVWSAPQPEPANYK
jgi:hypothetical protein